MSWWRSSIRAWTTPTPISRRTCDGIQAIRWGVNDDVQFGVSHRSYWSDNLAAWDYVLKMKRRGVNIRVTNNSYSQPGVESAAVREAIEAAGEEGILSVCTGGTPAINED